MTLMELVPRRLVGGVLLSSTLFASWAPNAHAARAPAAKTQRTDAKDGKPPSYDVLGKRYRVLASAAGYRERGIASWYGHPFDGRPTSSGEMYDMHEMTAAHRSLPIPTWVEVTNLANGKRVVVKVNDRGPFVDKRLIDLSFAAATKLDIVRDGTAQVEVRALPGPPARTAEGRQRAAKREAPPSQPESTAQASTAAPPRQTSEPRKPPEPPKLTSPDAHTEPERLFAEAGRFRTRDDAVRVVDDLKAQGFVNAFVVTEDGRRKPMHRVRVGPLRDGAEVDTMNGRLRELGARRSHSVEMR
jgi:rare lipoprotein A